MTAKAATRERVAAFLDNDYAKVVGAVALATGDRQRSEDAVQDALVKALTSGTDPDNLRGWVTLVAINYVRQSWRRDNAQGRAYVRAVTFEDAADTESQEAVDAISMRAAIERLPERQRATLLLHYYEGLSVRETARALGVTAGTVKTQLSRARDALSNDFQKEAVT